MITAPAGMSIPVKRSPTVCTALPSVTSSRSLLPAATELPVCSTSSAPAAIRFSKTAIATSIPHGEPF